MPVQSSIIACPAGQWTSIAQYMERRKILLVQCPESATTLTYTSSSWNPAVQILTDNPLRKSCTFSDPESGSAYISTDSGVFGTTPPYPAVAWHNSGGGATGNRPILNAEDWGEWVGKAWYGFAADAHPLMATWEELWTCRAVILGISTAGPTYTGPFGVVPVGLWVSPDLAGGPAIFRLSRELDKDLTIQEWFAWPVGSGTVNVQAFQSFDEAPAFDDRYIQIAGPKLTYGGLEALKEMIAEYGPQPGDANAAKDE